MSLDMETTRALLDIVTDKEIIKAKPLSLDYVLEVIRRFDLHLGKNIDETIKNKD